MNKSTKILFIVTVVSLFVGYFLIDIGINGKYFVKKDFNQAFQYRVTGDCTSFTDYVYQDNEKWNERCEKEKSRENEPIGNFKIIAVTHKLGSDKAFLQAELTRNLKTKEYVYPASYEMIKDGLKWKIMNEIK